MSPRLTVYYNTKCPVCNAGIDWQRNRLVQAARAGIIEFRDINLEPDALGRYGAGLEDVRRRLTTVSPICSTPGIAARGIGERASVRICLARPEPVSALNPVRRSRFRRRPCRACL